LSMDSVKLRKPVVPGDQLILVSEAVRLRSRTALCRCHAMVGDEKAAEAEIKFMLVDDDAI
jgi:3-hydroxymyristoyl/3-hydroxydecanoyl-(acyl carrier protein) dehydratase